MSCSLTEEFMGDLNEIKKDIVTVHGICSSTKDPWLDTDSKPKWIERDLFKRSDARVIVFGYQIEYQTSSGIQNLAKQLLQCLLGCRETIEESIRPLAFISQDFGGTIVKAALTIASQNYKKYGNIVNSTFALVFLGCPHRPDDRISLVENIATLLSRTRTFQGQGLVKTAQSIASTIVGCNGLFLESGILYRTRIINIFSDLPDERSLIFTKAVSTMAWSSETCIALPTDHASLLCAEVGKSCYRTVRRVLHFDDDSLWPYKPFPVGLKYLISQLPTVRLQSATSGVNQEELSGLGALSGWVQGQGPGFIHVEHPLGQLNPLHAIVRLLQSQTEAYRRKTAVLFTFEFRSNDYRSNDIWAALKTLVVQALCNVLPWFPESPLLERPSRFLTESRPGPGVFALFEAVNVFFAKRRVQALWVLCNIDQSSTDVTSLVGQLTDSCQYSEVKPRILFASIANPRISPALRQYKIQTLILGSPELDEGAASSVVKTMTMQSPRLIPFEDSITKMLQGLSQDPETHQVICRAIQKLADSDILGLTHHQQEDLQPDTVLQILCESLSEGERRLAARLLRWIDSSIRPLTISEATTAISLEYFLEMNFNSPWSSLAAVLSSDARKQIERVEQSLCGIISLDNNEVGYAQPAVRRIVLGQEWYPVDVPSHLHLLNRLLRFLELEADCLEDDTAALANTIQFRKYAAHYWPDHYRAASQSESTKLQAISLVKDFLKNDRAVQYTLDLNGGSICQEGTRTTALRKVALLARYGFDANDITHLTDCFSFLKEADLLFAAFMEAVTGSSKTFIQQTPLSPRLDPPRIRKVLSRAAMNSDPDFLTLLFEKIPPDLDIKFPARFLQRAAELGVQAILDTVSTQPERLEKQSLGLIFRQCVSFGHIEVAKRLAEIGSFKTSDMAKQLNLVLEEACQIGDPGIVESLLAEFPGEYDFTMWAHLATACNSGNYEAVQEILRGIDVTTDTRNEDRYRAIYTALQNGFTECATIILDNLDFTDTGGKLIIHNALILAVKKNQSDSCQLLFERFSDILDDPATTRLSLEAAIRQGNTELVELLIGRGAPIDADLNGTTPLHIASSLGHATIVEYLLSMGADVNSCVHQDGSTPLCEAAYYGYAEAVRLLLEHGADPRLADAQGWSPLEAAYDIPNIIKMLVNHAPRPDFKRRAGVQGSHTTALFMAAKNDYTETVRLLLQFDVDIEFEKEESAEYDQYFTALTAAVFYEASDTTVRLLLEHGADVNHVETDNGLHLLGRVKNERILATILEYNPNSVGLGAALNAACSKGMSSPIDCARRLINAGADVEALDTRDSNNDTPLTNACRYRDLELIKLLVKKGANVNGIKVCKQGYPLHVACDYNDLDVVVMLVDEFAADINRHHHYWGSPLQNCCSSKLDQTSKIEFLVRQGADVNAKGGVAANILTQACASGSVSAVQYLVDHGAQVSTANECGCLPVFAACFRGEGARETVQLLVSAGADVSTTTRDKLGRTALHCAVLSRDLDLVEYLVAKDSGLISAKDFDGWTPIHWAPRTIRSHLDRPEDLEETHSEKQVAILRFLIDKQCPGIHSTVKVGSDTDWTAIRIARYFGAPRAVQDFLQTLSQANTQVEESNATVDEGLQAGRVYEDYCDGCYCDLRGKLFVCQEPSCLGEFWLCIKCMPYKDGLHPFPDHDFIQDEGSEFEEDDHDPEQDEGSESEEIIE